MVSSIEPYTSHYVEKYYSDNSEVYSYGDYDKKTYPCPSRNPFHNEYDENLVGIKFFDKSGYIYNGGKVTGGAGNFSKMYFYGKRYTIEDFKKAGMEKEANLLEECCVKEAILCYNGSIVLNYDENDVCLEEIKKELGKEYIDSINFDRMDFYNGIISAFQIFHKDIYAIIEDKRYTINSSKKNVSIISGQKLAFTRSYEEKIEDGKLQKSRIDFHECIKTFEYLKKNYKEFEKIQELTCLQILGKDNFDIEKIIYDSAKKVSKENLVEKPYVKKYNKSN